MEGKQAEFEAMVGEQHARVLRLCCAWVGDRGLGEEVAQEVFLRAWRGWAGFRGEAAVGTWLYAIARHACSTALEKRRGREAASLDDPEVRRRAEARAFRSPAPARAAAADLAGMLAALPEGQRRALTLYYLGERSYAEIAAALELPMGTVKTWIHRGRERLAGGETKCP